MKKEKSGTTNILRVISLVLLTAMVFSVIVSCGGNTDNSNANNNQNVDNADVNQGEEENPQDVRIEPNLPDVTYDGYTFTFLSHAEGSAGWDWVTADPRELVAEEETGEPINDAVYRRNALIEQKYGITIAMVTNTDERSVLARTVRAGDDAYDAVVIFNNNVPGVVTNDLLTEISHLTHIDLEKPWWDPGVNAMSVANKQFLLAGDLLILDNEATNAIIFNKDLMANLGMELPYNLVKEGKWTMDKLLEMSKGSEMDLNGDGILNYNDDRFGFITFNDTLQALLVAGGGAFALKDANDIPYMSFAEPRNLNVLEKAMNLMYKDTNPSVFNVQSIDGSLWQRAYYGTFEENRALFMWIRMRVVEVFRGMEANFGIIPMPKYDEAQPAYCSLVNPYTGVLLGVPKSASDLERTSVILEALSAESKYTLQPAYYDIVLNRKFTRDEESSEMLDIIFGTRVYDIGGVYSFGNVFSDINGLASREDRNIMSYYEKRIGQMESAIAKLIVNFESIGE